MNTENINDFNFDKDIDLSKIELGNLNIEPQQNKIFQIYWHELGHLIGKFISKDLGFDIGKTLEIDFTDSSPQIKNDRIVSELHLRSFGPTKDFYGEDNGTLLDIFDENTKNFIAKNFDINILCPYIIYIFLGGFFNLYINSKLKNRLITSEEFDLIFKNIENDVNYSELEGCAGDDWRKIKEYFSAYEIPLQTIKSFRLELYETFDKHNFFNYFEKDIKHIFEDQITNYQDADLKNLEDKFKKLYETFPYKEKLIDDLQKICELFTKNNIV